MADRAARKNHSVLRGILYMLFQSTLGRKMTLAEIAIHHSDETAVESRNHEHRLGALMS